MFRYAIMPHCGNWAEAADYDTQDSVTFVTSWTPGTLTVQEDGTDVVGEYVDYLLLREEHLPSLDRYLESMSEVDPSGNR